MKLTTEQLFNLAKNIFNELHPNHEFGEFENLSQYVQNMWIDEAIEAIEGYNTVARYVEFPDLTIVKKCCRICKYVDLYRPACNLRGDDIVLECVCSRFELFEFENEEEL